MKSILIVSHAYAPARTARAFRWAALAEHWARAGHRVDVVCAPAPGLPAGLPPGPPPAGVSHGVSVYRAGSAFGAALRRRLRAAAQPAPISAPALGKARGTEVRGGGVARVLAVAAARAYRLVGRGLQWPDYAWPWYLPAVLAASKLLSRHRHDVLISVSHPFTGHLVGLTLAARWPRLRWIVDIGDPFALVQETPMNNRRLYGPLNEWAECAVIRGADAVSVTTDETRQMYAAWLPAAASKLYVIPPLLASDVERAHPDPASVPRSTAAGQKIVLTYAGTLYRGIRNPGPLLSLVSRLQQRDDLRDRLELHFYGDAHDCADLFEPYRSLLEHSLFVHGSVPHEVAQQALGSADVLVNVANDTVYQLPSKLVEYVATGKPVLNLATREGDPSSTLLSQYGAALTVRVEREGATDEQLAAIAAFLRRPPQVDPGSLDRLLEPFRLLSVAGEYERLFERASPRTAR